MFQLRRIQKNDTDGLFELSKLGNFINLPNNLAKIKSIVEQADHSFNNPSIELSKNVYVFVLEDLNKNKIIGTSSIHPQHGTEEHPHFYLTVGKEKKYSSSVDKYFIHRTLKLGIDTNGPTEIGGLVLDPSYRGHADKLGKQISFVRFLYMAIYPERFKQIVHSELLPPFDENGNSLLWDAVGRKFFHMDYMEADELSRRNKEFILNLFPSENIYQTLLSLDAQRIVGQVGPETKPVKKMLEAIGFKYTEEVDPFDGGPHYRCQFKDILPIKKMLNCSVKFRENLEDQRPYLITLNAENFKARYIQAEYDEKTNTLYTKEKINEIEVAAIPLFY